MTSIYYAGRSNAMRSISRRWAVSIFPRGVDCLDNGGVDVVVCHHIGGSVGQANDHDAPTVDRSERRLERSGPTLAVDLDYLPPETAGHGGRVDRLRSAEQTLESLGRQLTALG